MPTVHSAHTGLISTFGGPRDYGVSRSEGLALWSHSDLGTPLAGDLFLPYQPPGTTGMARRLNPDANYIAMRWDYRELPRDLLRRLQVTVQAGDKVVEGVRPADWGPNRGTGRVMDISPGLAERLGIHTDQEATVGWSYHLSKRTFENPRTPMTLEDIQPLSDEEIDEVAKHTCVAMELPEGICPTPPLAIWGNRGRFWSPQQTIRVRFKNGSMTQKNKAWERFKKLDELSGLSFKRVATGPADIRVAFNRGSGHWSYVGTDNLSIPQQHQTMNIDLDPTDSEDEWDRVVLHEGLHALGFNHEHQHPRDLMPWNRAAVYQLYARTQGWSRREIERQVLSPGDEVGFFGTEDLHTDSIMMYATHPKLVTDPAYAAPWNTKMSKEDIEQLKLAYPDGIQP